MFNYYLGFGTSPFSNYSYSKIGEKAVKHTAKLYRNITLCATISSKRVEMLRYFYEGGTKKEIFEEYFIELLKNLRNRYKEKKLVIVMDNLYSHKCSFILDIMQEYPNV